LVVIVNYRTPGLVIDCLASLAPEVAAVGETRVTVVDSASGDDSLERLGAAVATHDWQWVTLIAARKNGGFARGNNLAIAPALLAEHPPDFVWLLNPDTVVRPGALTALVDRMGKQPDAGIVGSRLEDPDGERQDASFRFFSLLGELDIGLQLGVARRLLGPWVVVRPQSERAEATDWVSGASLMVRRRVLEEVGLLDERYFLFFEEADLCLHARRAGWTVWHEPASRVVHLEGQSTGWSPEIRPQPRPGYWYDSRRRYFEKNHGRGYAAAADLSLAVGVALWRLRMALQGRPHDSRPRLVRDLLRHRLANRG
jgi:GT2 family glycosyltransferase